MPVAEWNDWILPSWAGIPWSNSVRLIFSLSSFYFLNCFRLLLRSQDNLLSPVEIGPSAVLPIPVSSPSPSTWSLPEPSMYGDQDQAPACSSPPTAPLTAASRPLWEPWALPPVSYSLLYGQIVFSFSFCLPSLRLFVLLAPFCGPM